MFRDHLKQGIRNLSFSIFTGPVYENKGNLLIKDNTVASVDEMLSMEYFTEN